MVALKYTVKDLEVKTELKGLEKRLSRPEQALKECGLVLLRSISKNFKAGGRPDRWESSKRVQKSGGQTLVKTARLKNSITMRVLNKVLTVGTNVKYAAIHQLGGRIRENVTVKKHWRYMDKAFGKSIPARHVMVKMHTRKMDFEMPERPFLLIQDADIRIFKRIFADYTLKGV